MMRANFFPVGRGGGSAMTWAPDRHVQQSTKLKMALTPPLVFKAWYVQTSRCSVFVRYLRAPTGTDRDDLPHRLSLENLNYKIIEHFVKN
jgi:hypothetical protein